MRNANAFFSCSRNNVCAIEWQSNSGPSKVKGCPSGAHGIHGGPMKHVCVWNPIFQAMVVKKQECRRAVPLPVSQFPANLLQRKTNFSLSQLKQVKSLKLKFSQPRLNATSQISRRRERDSPERNHTSTGQLDAHLASTRQINGAWSFHRRVVHSLKWDFVSPSVDQAPLAGLEKPQWITEACNGHGPTAGSSHAANKAEKSSENLRCPKSQQLQLQLSNSTAAAREEAHAEAVAATS